MDEDRPGQLRVELLGGVRVRADGRDVTDRLRRRALATLVLIAGSGERGVSRDTLIGLLWPDHDPERGRNNLSQALTAIRQALGDGAVMQAGAGVLRLDPDETRVDVWEFEAAARAHDHEAAVAAYGGRLAEGFSVSDLDEFERWIEGRGRSLEVAWTRSLRELAEAADRRGDGPEAVRWWRRLAAADPLSATGATGLMRALARTGDRAGALQHERIYRQLLETELDADPDPSVTRLAEELRRSPEEPVGPVPESTVSATLPAERPDPGRSGHAAGGVGTPQPAEATGAPPAHERPPRRSVGSRWSRIVGASAVAGLLAVIAFVVARGGGGEPFPNGVAGARTAGGSPTLAVFPFSVTGGSDAEAVGTSMVGLLGSALDGAGEVRSVPAAAVLEVAGANRGLAPQHAAALARRLGADLYVLGDVVESGSHVRLSGAIYEAGAGIQPVARASVEGEMGRLFELSDRLAAGLLADRYGSPQDRLRRLGTTSSSLEAVKAYLEGDRLFREGRHAEAADAFSRAVAADSAFPLAWFRLSVAADWAGRDPVALRAADEAMRRRELLSAHDGRFVEAWVEWRLGDDARAEEDLAALAEDYPDDPESWLALGTLLLQANPLRGRPAREALPALDRALALSPDDPEALLSRARLAELVGDRRLADSLVSRTLGVTGELRVTALRAFRAFLFGDRPGFRQTTRYLIGHGNAVPARIALEAAARGSDPDAQERFARALMAGGGSRDAENTAHKMLARTDLARGRWRDAFDDLAAAPEAGGASVLELRALAAAYPFLQVDPDRIEAIRGEVRAWNPAAEDRRETLHTEAHRGVHPHLRLHRIGLLSVRLGDLAAARLAADSIERLAGTESTRALGSMLAHGLRAHIAYAEGRPERALALLDSAAWRLGADMFEVEPYDRFVRAEALSALGREQEALNWYASLGERSSQEIVLVAPAALRMAEILDARGDSAAAVEHYRRFTELWQNPEPSLRPAVERARARARALAGR